MPVQIKDGAYYESPSPSLAQAISWGITAPNSQFKRGATLYPYRPGAPARRGARLRHIALARPQTHARCLGFVFLGSRNVLDWCSLCASFRASISSAAVLAAGLY